MTIPIRRAFVDVDGRRVHYRTAGTGRPIVMLHGSPGNSAMLEEEIEAAAPHFEVFALDTAGFGDSDALPGSDLSVVDLARATADALAALGLPPCPVFGTHTGAAIALELGVGWPERVTGLILDGVPIFTQAEMDEIFDGYFVPMVPSPLGGHLVDTWTRFRDQFTWFPWTSRRVERVNLIDRPRPEDIHLWTMMFFRSCRTYGPAYRAACFYGQQGAVSAGLLARPAVFMASEEDMLFPHLDRLPALRDDQRISRLPYDPAAKVRAIVDHALSLPQAADAAAAAPDRPAGHDPALQFHGVGPSQIFVRHYGSDESPALLLLHDAPGSGLRLEPLARALAGRFHVVLPDLPGCGESPLREGGAYLDTAAQALLGLIDTLGLDEIVVAGTGSGAVLAAALAATDDRRIAQILLEPAATAIDPDAVAPDLAINAEGSHWTKAWLMVRDGEVYAPWYAGTVAALRKDQGNFDADWLSRQTFEIMKARETYHHLPRAAARADIAQWLAATSLPVTQLTPGSLTADAIIAHALPIPESV